MGDWKEWMNTNRHIVGISAGLGLLFITAIVVTGHQGEKHMRHISDLVHKYDAASCEHLIQERTNEQTTKLQLLEEQVATWTAKSVHQDQVVKRTEAQDTEMKKQLTAAQNAAKQHKAEASRLAKELREALKLQDTLIQKMKGNEKAYEQAKNLEAMFKSVKDEYDATVPIVKEFQKQALNGK